MLIGTLVCSSHAYSFSMLRLSHLRGYIGWLTNSWHQVLRYLTSQDLIFQQRRHQDPTIFEGTLRFNIDPFGEFPDARVWEAVQAVQLMPYIRTLPEPRQVFSHS